VPRKGGEIDLKPRAYSTVEALYSFSWMGDGVLFVERTGELPSVARLSQYRRSHSESESEQGATWQGVDPKPSELLMARVKRA
jgi:hypothetical protein